MICPKCGRDNLEGVKFCIDCGTPLLRSVSDEPVENIAEEVETVPQPI